MCKEGVGVNVEVGCGEEKKNGSIGNVRYRMRWKTKVVGGGKG